MTRETEHGAGEALLGARQALVFVAALDGCLESAALLVSRLLRAATLVPDSDTARRRSFASRLIGGMQEARLLYRETNDTLVGGCGASLRLYLEGVTSARLV